MPENVEEMARVAAHTSIPIATGERLVTKYEFARVLENKPLRLFRWMLASVAASRKPRKSPVWRKHIMR